MSRRGTLETLESIFIMLSLINAAAIHRNAVDNKFEINHAFDFNQFLGTTERSGFRRN